jgi:hypothetical protein
MLRQSRVIYSSTATVLTVAVLFFSMLPRANGFTVQLSEQSRPYLILSDDQGAVRWTHGTLLQQITGSLAVRITDNRVRIMTRVDSGDVLKERYSLSARCDPVQSALCVVNGDGLSKLGIGHGSQIFPEQGTIVVHGNITKGCSDGAGRVSTKHDHATQHSARYDISACDVFDSNIDILYMFDEERGNFQAYIAPTGFNQTLYGVVGLLVICCIVVITQNLAIDVLHSSKAKGSPISLDKCIALGALLVICCAILPGVANTLPEDRRHVGRSGTSSFFYPVITQTEYLYFVILVLYLVLQSVLALIFIGIVRTDERRGKLHTVNFLVSVVLLALLSSHGTVETALTPALLFVLLFRTTFKFCSLEIHVPADSVDSACKPHEHWHRTLELILITLDNAIILGTLNTGVLPINSTDIEGMTFATMLTSVAISLGVGAAWKQNKTQNRTQNNF